MKTLNVLTSSVVLASLSLFSHVHAAEFAALAIDKNNGFAYGWSYNHPSLNMAEKYAQDECSKRSGKRCTVVLSWSGEGCGVYRTVEGHVGTAYGWGIARTQAEADKIATQNVLKRSNGKIAPNHVWACNSTDKTRLKVIKNDDSDVKTVKIGSQVWMAENLSVSHFRNGDVIPLAKNADEWEIAGETTKPISRVLEDNPVNEKKYGRYYNWYAATDSRGVCPAGFHVPSKAEWEVLINTIGGLAASGRKLRSKESWKQQAGTNDYGFNALPMGSVSSGGTRFDGVGGSVGFWSSTPQNNKYVWYFSLLYDDSNSYNGLNRYPREAGRTIRCIQD